jgi:amino acid adenylation domain-containing protein
MVAALEAWARRTPDAPALIDPTTTVSYRALWQAVGQIGDRLARCGARPNDRVVICSENAVAVIAAIYGTLAARCTFVPMSPFDPDARLLQLCERTRPAAIFAPRRKQLPASLPLRLVLEDVFGDGDGGGGHAPAVPGAPEPAPNEPGDAIAYIIFTSGSTGQPKGVCISHRSLFQACEAAARAMGFDATTRSLVILPLHFDGSFSSVFPVLLTGGCLFVHRGPMCPPATFVRLMHDHALTHTTVTPTYLRALMADQGSLRDRCASWRTVAVGGEQPPKPELRRLRAELPRIRMFNRYGPTEATMAVSTTEISDAMLASDDKIPIGAPHPGVEFIALGLDGEPCRVGERAELYLGGAQLMTGYLDDPEATAAVLGPLLGGTRTLLRTGDVITVNPSGQYVFVERIDSVVKRNGTRVSLDEIEAGLARVAGVGSAACVKLTAGDRVRIVAFVQRTRADLQEREVRRDLLRELPAAMSPDVIRFVDDLPQASGGKVDRAALARLASTEVSPDVE